MLMADILYRLCQWRGVKVLRYDYFRINILRVAEKSPAAVNVIIISFKAQKIEQPQLIHY